MKSVSRLRPGALARRPAQWLLRAAAAAALFVGLCSAPVRAIQPVEPSQGIRTKLSRPFIAPELQVKPDLEPSLQLSAGAYVLMKNGVGAFLQRQRGSWELRWDRRSDRPNLIQGSGVALLPGKGNALTAVDLGLDAGASIDLALVETRLRDFIAANEDLLQTRGLEFRLDPASSAAYGDGDTHWFVEFAQYAGGVRVDRANLFFRVSHGNIVQLGEELVAPVTIDTRPSLTRTDAFDAAWRELAFPAGTQIVETRDPGELVLLPVAPSGEPVGESYAGPTGAGYSHRLAWRFVFRVDDDDATYEVLFDAHAGAIIEVRNLAVYADATVSGGIYPTTNSDAEVIEPMPFAAVSNGGAKITDVLGIYDYSGGTASTALDGKYFRMNDNCGPISLSSSTDGNLALGSSGGTDCSTPGVGGAGNTHASRTGFYHLTNINRKAALYHPSNNWLASKVTANMNIDNQCNAGWDGSTVNFFKSGGGCSNTGEIAAVFLHEWGHGMDTNTGGAASDYGSGEAVGDTFAFLETKDACIGRNFMPNAPCANCEPTCTGVRDLDAFSTHGAATIAKPSTITDDGGPNCDRWACPYLQMGIFPYQGPMGYEGHCESYIAGSANWDLTQALIEKFGESEGWQKMDGIWYGSLVPSKSAYRVTSGGQCNVAAQVDGCGSNNWYTVYLAADDDDGNLANGTPNACRIWDAFNAHGIACGARPECSGDDPDFTLAVANPSQATCAPGSASYTIDVGAERGFANAVTLSASGTPAGVSASFTPNPVAPGSSATLALTTASGTASGSSTIIVNGTASGSPGHSKTVDLRVTAGIPVAPTLSNPSNGDTGTILKPVFTWTGDPAALSYTIEIATDAGFTAIVASASTANPTWTPAAPLQTLTTYYWRVKANSPCGDSVSPAYTFTTGRTFPEPYCSVTFSNAVEPITRVVIGGIDKASGATVDGSPALEDFTAIQGDLAPGGSASIIVEGNTAGNYSDYVSAYVDWNRNGSFDSGERYDIGSIVNSSGVDGKQATGTIAAPADAAVGNTRLRVIKKYSNAAAYPDACNTGGWGQAEDYTIRVGGSPTYTVGGNVGGLSGGGLVLSLNAGAQSLAVTGNGAFVFPSGLTTGAAYEVLIDAQPSGQTCSVANGSGTIATANVTDVAVTCVTDAGYTVGGSVSGLTGGELVLELNGGAGLTVGADGPFVFPEHLADGAGYAVTIAAQPPGHDCSIANGGGTVAAADVTDVAVTCSSDRIFADGFDPAALLR